MNDPVIHQSLLCSEIINIKIHCIQSMLSTRSACRNYLRPIIINIFPAVGSLCYLMEGSKFVLEKSTRVLVRV